jgi:hypothetical protein
MLFPPLPLVSIAWSAKSHQVRHERLATFGYGANMINLEICGRTTEYAFALIAL